MYDSFINLVREIYDTKNSISLHEPRFFGNEKKYLMDTIDSTFVSSVGHYVDDFENAVAAYTGSAYAISTVNGTAALHTALVLAGVKNGDEVITQSLTFVATCNAIRYCNAEPVFVDVSKETLGLSEKSMLAFLEENCEIRNDGFCWNKKTNKIIRACLPMHTFGFPVELNAINLICQRYNIILVEDAAESLGSFYKEKHTGTVGKISAISFNGNKIITTGGGGMLLTNDYKLADKAKHITTTAKVKNKWAFEHDEVGFNYRLPNLNAALGLAQMELLPKILIKKRIIAQRYQDWGEENGIQFIKEPSCTKSNYWLNAVLLKDKQQRDEFLDSTNKNGIMTRPIWKLVNELKMYKDCQVTELENAKFFEERVVNIPSSIKL